MILIEKDKKEDIVFCVLCCLFALFMLFKIRFGLHYDEGYLVDLGKLKIDRIHSITQCWDVLQMSGWIVYPLLLLYRTVTGGYEGSILFIRVIYILIHLLIAIYVYTTVRLFWTKKQARVASLLSFLFLFHWYTICYKSVLYWGVMLTILFLLRYTYFKKRRYIVVGSIIFSVAVLAYPSLVLLTIPISSYFIGTKEIQNKDLIVFWGVCIFCAIVFLIGIAAESSLETLLQTYQYTISYESSNSSHKLITLIELTVIYIIVNMCLRYYFKNRWINKRIRNVLVSDTLFSFSTLPIKLVEIIGTLSFGGAIIWGIIVLVLKIMGVISVHGWTTLFIFMLFSFGMTMVTLGILGEYLWRTFDASRNRPTYIIEDKGFK